MIECHATVLFLSSWRGDWARVERFVSEVASRRVEARNLPVRKVRVRVILELACELVFLRVRL